MLLDKFYMLGHDIENMKLDRKTPQICKMMCDTFIIN